MPSDARAGRAAQPSPGSTASAGRPTARPDEGRLPRPLRSSFILLLALATVALSGFHFGPDDNSFHIAIVLDYMSLPQFRDDETIQSLRAFISPLYHLLRPVADATTVETWFLALFLVTRLATVAAFLALVERLSSAGPVPLLAATAGVFLASMPYGSSQVGWTGLMVRHFSHSELAQACALWALVAMGDRKAVRAGALVGLTAFFNLFVGIWLLLPWAVMFIRIARQGAVDAAAIRGAGASMLLALLGAAPPVLMHLVTRRPHEPFDYREFIVTFYYHHFMLGKELEPGHILFVCLLAAGLLCMVPMRQRARAALLAVLLPLLAVFAIGIVVGWTTNSLMLFNLHLLRVDGLIVWVLLAAVAAGMAACLADGRGPAIAAACLVVVALMRPWQPWLLLASGVATAVALRLDALRALPRPLSSRASPLVAAAVFLAVLAAAHLRDWHYPGGPRPLAQGATPTNAHFLGARPAAAGGARFRPGCGPTRARTTRSSCRSASEASASRRNAGSGSTSRQGRGSFGPLGRTGRGAADTMRCSPSGRCRAGSTMRPARASTSPSSTSVASP
ncbi:MAG: hypothetical protein NZM07_02505 [Elioraea sp.]|nr:hypothetical protein [Elioraea sp.]